MLLNFDNWGSGGSLEQSYGYVQGATISVGTGISGGNSLRTTAAKTGDYDNGVYEGFASQNRKGTKAIWVKKTVTESDSALLDIWQGDSFLKLKPSGLAVQIATANSGTLYSSGSVLSAVAFVRLDLQWEVSTLDAGNQLNYDGMVQLKIADVIVFTATNIQLGFALPIGDIRDVYWNVIVFNPHGDGGMHALTDGSGVNNTGYLPTNVAIYNSLPTSDGTYSEMALSTGTASYALVDDAVPDDSATYLSVSGSALKSTFNFADFGSIGTQFVYGIKHTAHGRKMEPGYRRFRPLIVRAGLPYFAPVDYPAGIGYFAWQQHVWELDPVTGSRWLVDDINVTEFGSMVG